MERVTEGYAAAVRSLTELPKNPKLTAPRGNYVFLADDETFTELEGNDSRGCTLVIVDGHGEAFAFQIALGKPKPMPARVLETLNDSFA